MIFNFNKTLGLALKYDTKIWQKLSIIIIIFENHLIMHTELLIQSAWMNCIMTNASLDNAYVTFATMKTETLLRLRVRIIMSLKKIAKLNIKETEVCFRSIYCPRRFAFLAWYSIAFYKLQLCLFLVCRNHSLNSFTNLALIFDNNIVNKKPLTCN